MGEWLDKDSQACHAFPNATNVNGVFNAAMTWELTKFLMSRQQELGPPEQVELSNHACRIWRLMPAYLCRCVPNPAPSIPWAVSEGE